MNSDVDFANGKIYYVRPCTESNRVYFGFGDRCTTTYASGTFTGLSGVTRTHEILAPDEVV